MFLYKKEKKNTMKGCKERNVAKIIWKKGYNLKKKWNFNGIR